MNERQEMFAAMDERVTKPTVDGLRNLEHHGLLERGTVVHGALQILLGNVLPAAYLDGVHDVLDDDEEPEEYL
jgi:hypothetical protein